MFITLLIIILNIIKQYLFIVYQMIGHKLSKTDIYNDFDFFSSDPKKNGIMLSNQLWTEDMILEEREETILIYGTNSEHNFLLLKFHKKPININNNQTFDYCSYELLLVLKGKTYSANESGILYHRKSNSFQFNGLTLEVLQPFKQWRIRFIGYLRENGNQNEMLFTKLNFLWLSNSQVFNFNTNFDTNYSTNELFESNRSLKDIIENRFTQCGQLKGLIDIENNINQEINLWGTRGKDFVKNEMLVSNDNKSCIIGYSKKGIAFELVNIYRVNFGQRCVYGFGSTAYGYAFPVQQFESKSKRNNQLFLNDFSYKVNKKLYEVNILDHLENGFVVISINGHIGGAVVMNHKNSFQSQKDLCRERQVMKSFAFNSKTNSEKLVINLSEEICSNTDICGGKGSSLSLLIQLKHKLNNFEVPEGFVITTNGFNLMLKENKDLEIEIEKLQQKCWSENREDLNDQCLRVSDLFSHKSIPEIIRKDMKTELKQLNKYNNSLFAVRSSASGEDSENMSFAGQMTTILGVKGMDSICEAIIKCWSSQFSVTAVEYKRNYGQLINSPMAVVVQTLIDCDVSGVLFTCDPITADQRRLVINSNYGIGETVVSGDANPDTVILKVNVESNNIYENRSIDSIESIKIGDKEKVLRVDEKSGTKCVITENSNKNSSLTKEDAISLGKIALSVQSYFGSVRDIEWGLKDGVIYLLQSRPITNFEMFSEWELSHELDDGHNDEHEYHSKANAGEVLPGSLTPLDITLTLRQIGLTNSRQMVREIGIKRIPIRKYLSWATVNKTNCFVALKDRAGLFQIKPKEKENFFDKAMAIAILGHLIDENELRIDCDERWEEISIYYSFKQLYLLLKNAYFLKTKLEKVKKRIEKMDLFDGTDFKSSHEMAVNLMKKLHLVEEIMDTHIGCTQNSAFLNFILLGIISKGDLSSNSLNDFSNVLSGIKNINKVISADVPNAINHLASIVKKYSNDFIAMNPNNALQWLINDSAECGQKFREFIADYGHRGYKELLVNCETWRENPIPVIENIQTLIRSGNIRDEESAQYPDWDQILKKIRRPLNCLTKLFLKHILIPKCQKGIALREEAKSTFVKYWDKQRQYIRKMSKMMAHNEGRIPDKDLIYFLTWDEIIRLTEYRDPLIVSKAIQRKRLHKKLDQFIYEEIIVGPDMKPINLNVSEIDRQKYMKGNNLIISGTPVSAGVIEGRVCVVHNFDEVKNIQFGDILCTYSTDIGWSPYFPLLSGIITEMGGLISHGAVIAREYGLPAVIGIKNICQILKSGDRIVLNADEGLIVLINDNLHSDCEKLVSI